MQKKLGRLSRLLYVWGEIVYFTLSLFSRCLNALVFGGSMHQTLSARTHIEARHCPVWKRREKFINHLFFWEEDHCAAAWHDEVARARKTLIRNGDPLVAGLGQKA